MTNIPPEPDERCHCIVPDTRRGMDFKSGFGVTFCAACSKFIRWGVGPHPLVRA